MKLRHVLPTLALLALSPLALAAQEHAATPATPTAAQEPAHAVEKPIGPADIIMPHITDSHEIEYPCPLPGKHNWSCGAELPTWKIGSFDISPTKHVVFMWISAASAILMLGLVARAHNRRSKSIGRPTGFAAGIESVILYLRNEIYMPVLGGHGGERYVPFCLTLFFFIVWCNLWGLMPWGSTATGNVMVTATLAIITFFVVEIAGMKALGKGYLGTIIYWPHDMPLIMKAPMTLIMTPVELAGKITKPFALTVRLFANMIAGHVIILALIGLIFMFGFKIAVLPVAMALFIMFLEILVAFIQAFIFSLLAAVFIGQIRSAHH
jgi:F-type H+-transporting ATPase subunit a